MANDIKVPGFVNCTDLRVRNEVPAIEAETIRNYARSLSDEEMKIFLCEVPDDVLIASVHRRLLERQYKLDSIEKHFNIN